MATPPDQVAAICLGIVFLIFCGCGYCVHRLTSMCQQLTNTIRTMGLAASNPVLAAKLEQQRLRSGPSRAAVLAEIASHQGAKARERHAQNRAANPSSGKPTTMRYVAPDDDLLPEKKQPSRVGDTILGPPT